MLEFVSVHPVLAVVLASALTTLTTDLQSYIAFRKDHPGASYDFVVVALRLVVGGLGPLVLLLGSATASLVSK